MKKQSRRKGKPFGRHVQVVAVEAGRQVRTTGIRSGGDGGLVGAPKTAKPVLVNRVYTGVNKGRVYPYASKKRGGGNAALER